MYLQTYVPKICFNQLLDAKSAGHLGQGETMDKVRARYMYDWPGITGDVSRWCKTCAP